MKYIKKYLKTLLPYRWIFVSIFIILSQIILSCMYSLSLDDGDFYLFTSLNIPYWIVVDIFLGIGRSGILLSDIKRDLY